MDTLNKEIGALSASMQNIEREMAEARESRRRQFEKLEGMERRLDRIEFRQENTEKQLGVISPTVSEFSAYKLNAQGAGKFGVFLWKLGGFILSVAAGAAAAGAWLSATFTWK